jgi:hypothetical protein
VQRPNAYEGIVAKQEHVGPAIAPPNKSLPNVQLSKPGAASRGFLYHRDGGQRVLIKLDVSLRAATCDRQRQLQLILQIGTGECSR